MARNHKLLNYFMVSLTDTVYFYLWSFDSPRHSKKPGSLCFLSLMPGPHPQKCGTHRALSGACWRDISEFCRTNQIHAMWLACDHHVIPRDSQLLLHVRAVDALPYQNDALSWQLHDMLHPGLCAPKSAGCVPDPFLLLGVGSGHETIAFKNV